MHARPGSTQTPRANLTRTGRTPPGPHVGTGGGYGREVIDLREAPSATHPRPGRLPGVRLTATGRTGAIWIADHEPPLPQGFTPIEHEPAA